MHDVFACARWNKLLDEQLPSPYGSGSQSGRLMTTDASLMESAPAPSSGSKPTETSGEACVASDGDDGDASATTATTAASLSVLPLPLDASTERIFTPSMVHGTADAVLLCTPAVQPWPDRVSAGGGVLPGALVLVALSRMSTLQCSAAAVAPSARAMVADVMLIEAAAAAAADVYGGSEAGGDAGGDA